MRGLNEPVAQISVRHTHFENLAVIAELREDDSGLHIYRVGRLSALIAAELGHGDLFCAALERAARLHDIGKLAIRDQVITKPGKLNSAEFEHVARHTIYGHRLLSLLTDDGEMSREVALCHHEYWGGGGYPRKLVGIAIPESARIVAVADCFESLCHVRPYRKEWTVEESLAEIRSLSGAAFEPRIVRSLEAVVTKLRTETNASTPLDQLLVPDIPSSMLRARGEVLALIDTLPLPWQNNEQSPMFI